jgi:hypothetical protein
MKKISLLFFLMLFSIIKLSAQVYGWGEVGASSDSIFNGYIMTTGVDAQNNIYAAGSFFDSSGNFYVAKWNGTSWNRLGKGSNALNANAMISDMVIDTFGNIYVGGFFNSANQGYIEKWDGNTWSIINVTVPGYNFAGSKMTVDLAGNLYTSVYTIVNNPTKNEVAKWNGTSWSLLGSSSTLLNANDQILAIASDAQGNIYAAGKFSDSLNPLVGNLYVAKWNGTNLGSLTNSTSYLKGLSRSAGITNILPDAIGNVYIHYYESIYKWNGLNWAILDSIYSADGYYQSMCTDTFNNLYSLDMTKRDCAKWNGMNWIDLTGSNPALSLHSYSGLTCILSDKKNDIYTTGLFLNSKGGFYVAKFGLQNCISYFTVDYDTAINTFNINTDTSITTKMATSYHWDFGDGTSSNLQFPTHTYLVDTAYNVCLTIKTSTGDSCTYCHTIGKDYLGNIIKSGGFNLNVKGQGNIGVNESKNEKTELLVYPNPAKESLVIGYQSLVNTIEITDVAGRVCISVINNKSKIINIESLASGIYFIKATDEMGNVKNAKFVKE